MIFHPGAFIFGFSQGFVIGPLSIYGIEEGLNPRKGFWYQIQVLLGSAVVDIIYLFLAAKGAAFFLDFMPVRVAMWYGASYLLITMGVNTFHERAHKLSLHDLYRHKQKFYETDFFKGFLINLINPLAIVFWVVVAGSLYADYRHILSPISFALHITIGTTVSSTIVALITLALRKTMSKKTLQKLISFGAVILVGYGVWFFWKAISEIQPQLYDLYFG